MGGTAGVMGRFLVLAFFVVVGMGVYTFMVKTDLQAAQMKIATVEADRDKWQKSATQYVSANKDNTAKVAALEAQVKDLQAQLEAASKKGGKR
jgi:cell division protein FtsB